MKVNFSNLPMWQIGFRHHYEEKSATWESGGIYDAYPIPIMKEHIHEEIRSRVGKSNELLQKGKNIIDYSCHAIEEAIERNDSEGLNYLSSMIDA